MAIRSLILAGGLGTRSVGYLGDTPKFLAPIGGVPLCDVLLDQLGSQGMLPTVVALAHDGRRIRDRLSGRPDVHLDLDDAQRGTAGAVRHVVSSGYGLNDPLLIVNGDTLFNVHMRYVLWFFADVRCPCLTITAGDVPVARLVSAGCLEEVVASSEPLLEKLLPPCMTYSIPQTAYVDVGTIDGYRRAQEWKR